MIALMLRMLAWIAVPQVSPPFLFGSSLPLQSGFPPWMSSLNPLPPHTHTHPIVTLYCGLTDLSDLQLCVVRGLFSLSAVTGTQREEWRCASMRPGAPSATTVGHCLMPVWFADSWDSLAEASAAICYIESIVINKQYTYLSLYS